MGVISSSLIASILHILPSTLKSHHPASHEWDTELTPDSSVINIYLKNCNLYVSQISFSPSALRAVWCLWANTKMSFSSLLAKVSWAEWGHIMLIHLAPLPGTACAVQRTELSHYWPPGRLNSLFSTIQKELSFPSTAVETLLSLFLLESYCWDPMLPQ